MAPVSTDLDGRSLRADLRAAAAPVLGSLPSPAARQATLERRMRWYAVWQVLDIAVLVSPVPFGWKVATAVAFALYRNRTVWTIIHERVHTPWARPTPASLFYDFCTGWIAWWWRRPHLAHHAATNTERDPDTRLLVGRDLTVPRDGPRWGRLLGALAQLVVFFPLFFTQHLRAHRGPIGGFLLGLLAYAALLNLLLPRPEAILNTVCNFGLGTLYIVGTFAPTHGTLANFQRPGPWVADQLHASNDVWSDRPWYSWLCGGINQHIEHHLFPHVPYERLSELVPVVRRFAADRGLPYHAFSPLQMWRAHLRLLARR